METLNVVVFKIFLPFFLFRRKNIAFILLYAPSLSTINKRLKKGFCKLCK